MNARRIYAIFLRQVYLARGNPMRFFQLFVWTTIDVIIWGFLSKYLMQSSGSHLNFLPLLLGAVLLWDFLGQVMQGISMPFLEDMWSQNFLNFFGSPLTMAEYVSGFIIASIARSAISLTAMLGIATLIFGLPMVLYGASLVLFLSILFLFGITLGIISLCILLRFGPSAEWLVWPIPALVAPFVGVFYPLTILPHWMQVVGSFLPPSYVFASARAIISGNDVAVSHLIFGIALSIVYLALAFRLFMSVYRHAINTGRIAHFSAENA